MAQIVRVFDGNLNTGSNLNLALRSPTADSTATYNSTAHLVEDTNVPGGYRDSNVPGTTDAGSLTGVYLADVSSSTGTLLLRGYVRLSGVASAIHELKQIGNWPRPTDYSDAKFPMISSADNVSPTSGLTVTVAVCRQTTAGFSNSTTSVTEISGGWYSINLNPYCNCNILGVKATATGAIATQFDIQM